MVAPDVFDCLENPWKLRHIFTCKQDKLKDYYGKYSINKPKSELIVEGSKEYFQVSKICILLATKGIVYFKI